MQFDLEPRTLKLAQRVNEYVLILPKIVTNIENGKQLVRSAGSVGANYIEANESLSKKDFYYRIRICRKEVKESRFWLTLSRPDDAHLGVKDELVEECTQLIRIFSAILANDQR